MRTPQSVLVLVFALLTACQAGGNGEAAPGAGDAELSLSVAGPTSRDVPPEILDEARSAANALGSQLQARLVAALEEGGPLRAVDVCAVEAQAIAGSLSVDGTVGRRVSLRTRNPLNDPDPWETARLEVLSAAWGAADVPAEEWEVVQEEGGAVLRYLRPIPLARPCTTCHGAPDQIPAEVLTLLRELYPRDRAVDYAPGDLRGAVSVRIPLASSH